MRVLTVFGTRPEVIKLAPVIGALRNRGLQVIVCASGQHRGMLDQMLEIFRIQPDFDLDVMQEDQSSLSVAARIFEELAPVLDRVRPDWLLVQGDTTTTFAAAWVGYQHRIPIGHVEAGLRTYDKFRPFPEEMNRRLTSALADLHFAPTERAAANLRGEGVKEESIVVTGNPVVDALESILSRPVDFADARLAALTGSLVLVTAHRRESFGEPLERVCVPPSRIFRRATRNSILFPGSSQSFRARNGLCKARSESAYPAHRTAWISGVCAFDEACRAHLERFGRCTGRSAERWNARAGLARCHGAARGRGVGLGGDGGHFARENHRCGGTPTAPWFGGSASHRCESIWRRPRRRANRAGLGRARRAQGLFCVSR